MQTQPFCVGMIWQEQKKLVHTREKKTAAVNSSIHNYDITARL